MDYRLTFKDSDNNETNLDITSDLLFRSNFLKDPTTGLGNNSITFSCSKLSLNAEQSMEDIKTIKNTLSTLPANSQMAIYIKEDLEYIELFELHTISSFIYSTHLEENNRPGLKAFDPDSAEAQRINVIYELIISFPVDEEE